MKNLSQNRLSKKKNDPQNTFSNNRNKCLLLSTTIFLMTCTSGFTADLTQQPVMNAPRIQQSAQPINLDRLQGNINTIETGIQVIANQHQHARGKVIVIGPSGSGKSTLLHHLADKDLVAGENEAGDGRQLTPTQVLTGLDISHSPRVGTNFPGAWYDQTNQLVYWDCPGLGDPRKVESEIYNAFAIHHLFENTKVPLKILLVTSESTLSDRGINFLDLLNDITEKFPDDRLLKCLSLVITKQDRINVSMRLTSLLSEERSLNNRAKRLLHHLVTHPHQVAVFPYPSQNGVMDTAHKTGILLSINTAQFINNLTVCRTVDNSTKNTIINLAQKLNEQIERQVKVDVGRVLINFCKTMVNQYNGSVDTLRQTLTSLKGDIKDLKSIPTATPDTFITDLERILGQHQEFDGLKNSINQLKFLHNINPNVSYQISRWAKALKTIRTKINELSTPPTSHYQNNILHLKGYLIGTSDINNLPTHQRSATQIHVWSLNTILVDQNLTLPGVSVSMLAPVMKIDSNKVISLEGNHGVSYTIGAVNGTAGTATQGGGRGSDGAPGGHGEPGGNFYAKGGTGNFINFNNLQIITNGGNGGNGQNGGHGGNGANGLDGNPNYITNTKEYFNTYVGGIDEKYRKHPEMRAWINNDDIARHEHKHIKGVKCYYENSGTSATNGGDAGQGGARGLGGVHGAVVIEGTHWGPHVATDGIDGTNGIHGTLGQGGTHGRNHYGVLITKAETFIERHEKPNYWHKLPDRWLVNPGYHASTQASNGNSAPTLNTIGQQTQTTQVALNTASIVTDYRTYYWKQYQLTLPFVKAFTGL